jgi:hypothetical protein
MRLRTVVLAGALVLGLGLPAVAADDSRVKAATRQVETGAKKIGEGKIGQGVEETAKGIGATVVEGAKFTGEKIKEGGDKVGDRARAAGREAAPPAKSAWQHVRDGAVDFGTSVKNFFGRLFGG